MIAIKGATFGKLAFTFGLGCLIFWSEPRKCGPGYRYSSLGERRKKSVCKRWRIAGIKEMVVKRYSLMRQAVEIYFEDGSSAFFNFFSRERRVRFTTFVKLAAASAFKSNKGFTLVRKPEKHFLEKRFPERWMKGELSNFEYLALLNKYGGRSFNDLGQYPIFPWVLKDYTSPSLIESSMIYRDFTYPIAAISELKRKEADQKLNALVREGKDRPFQFDAHYLPAKAVLGYMLRLEPYSSLAGREKKHREEPTLHYMEKAWQSVLNDPKNNSELIPEFFYSPSIFPNFNEYYFCSKVASGSIVFWEKIVVDQVVLPEWAKSPHVFIEKNATALESDYVSHGLNEWVDLVFGIKQQDPRIYNLFRELCEETTVRKRRKTLTDENLGEIQESGTIPIKLFRQLHPGKDFTVVSPKSELSLFGTSSPASKAYVLRKLATVGEPVVGILSWAGKTLVLGNSGSLYRLKSEQHASGTVLDFHAKIDTIHPRRKPFNSLRKAFLYDGQRTCGIIDNPQQSDDKVALLYSGFYDNTIKTVVLSGPATTGSSAVLDPITEHPRVEDVLKF